jgi:hypothetical protein
VGVGTSVTNRLPGPLGTLGTRVLESLENTVDGILPPIGRAPSQPGFSPQRLLSSLRSGLQIP